MGKHEEHEDEIVIHVDTIAESIEHGFPTLMGIIPNFIVRKVGTPVGVWIYHNVLKRRAPVTSDMILEMLALEPNRNYAIGKSVLYTELHGDLEVEQTED